MNYCSKIITSLIVVVLFLNSYVHGQRIGRMVFLSGTIRNYEKGVQVEDMSEIKDLKLEDSLRILKVDNAGNFSISFELFAPNYFRIGRNILYLSPRESISMDIDYNNPFNSTFKGNNSEANQYLKSTPLPKGGSFLESGDSLKSTLKETIHTILSAADKRRKLLNNYKQLPAKFRLLETARIKADIINSLFYIDNYFLYIHKLTKDASVVYRKYSKKVIEPYLKYYSKDFLNQDFLKIVVYRDIVSLLLDQNSKNSKNSEPIIEWRYATTLFDKIKSINKRIDNSNLIQQINKIKKKEYRMAILSAFSQVSQFNIGDNAIDFDMINIKGETVSINKYKGKVIFIDLWATWCGPCLDEFPFLDSLKQKYKDNNSIVFISLSIDTYNNTWKKYLNQNGKMNGPEYIIDRLKLKAYSVNEIPRIIIITKDYKIAKLNGPLPSSKETKNIIDSLL